ncbi:MAG: thioesterase family protein [bacterium]
MNHPLKKEPVTRTPVRIYFFDTDAAGVTHNVAYLRLIELARSHFAEALGWPLREMLADNCPVVARTEIDYLKPARLGDELEIKAELKGMEKVRFYIAFEVTRPADDAVICRAVQTMVTVDLQTGRPKPLRQDWRERWPHLVRS